MHFRDMLGDNTALKRWDLGNNRLGDGGAADVAAGLAMNTGLLNLNLAHNRIGAEGAGARSRAPFPPVPALACAPAALARGCPCTSCAAHDDMTRQPQP